MKAGTYIAWSGVTVLVFGWHLLWWGMITPQPLPEKLVSAPSTIRYLPIPEDNKDPRLKEILTPLIFSTPSIAGFSRPLLEKEAQSVPPLRVVQDLSLQLSRKPSGVTRKRTVYSTDIQPEVKQQLEEFTFALPANDPYEAVAIKPGIHFDWQGELNEQIIDFGASPRTWLSLTNRSWEAVVNLRFDPQGKIELVLMEGEASPVIRTPLIQWAWRLRADPGSASRRGRVAIQVQP